MQINCVRISRMGSHLPDIFLSYDRDDQATAQRFAEGFEPEGFNVWLAAPRTPPVT
jgi:hypothetical protein